MKVDISENLRKDTRDKGNGAVRTIAKTNHHIRTSTSKVDVARLDSFSVKVQELLVINPLFNQRGEDEVVRAIEGSKDVTNDNTVNKSSRGDAQ